jgi:hypothetical protein
VPEPAGAVATVAVDRPERYVKQLAAHLGRRCGVREEANGATRILFGDGECLLRPRAGALELHATAADADRLDRVADVVGRHLERFGVRDELTVAWRRG